mmetsp:Transcript_34916/g.99004  ORF Transcript_34916/g.99004 Transcript_34916/m.99004 type:complete len:246 (-) Transcript_34916:65-802(-)
MYGWQLVPSNHNVLDAQHQPFADSSCRVIHGVLVLGEITGQHERDSDRVAKEHLNCCGCHWRQVEGAELALQRQVDGHVARLLELVPLHGGDADELAALGACVGHQTQQLLGASRLGEEHQQIILPDDPDVAVQGIRWRKEDGLGAGRHKRLRDLLGDEARLADAREDDDAGAAQALLAEALQRLVLEVLEEVVHEAVLLGEQLLQFRHAAVLEVNGARADVGQTPGKRPGCQERCGGGLGHVSN